MGTIFTLGLSLAIMFLIAGTWYAVSDNPVENRWSAILFLTAFVLLAVAALAALIGVQ